MSETETKGVDREETGDEGESTAEGAAPEAEPIQRLLDERIFRVVGIKGSVYELNQRLPRPQGVYVDERVGSFVRSLNRIIELDEENIPVDGTGAIEILGSPRESSEWNAQDDFPGLMVPYRHASTVESFRTWADIAPLFADHDLARAEGVRGAPVDGEPYEGEDLRPIKPVRVDFLELHDGRVFQVGRPWPMPAAIQGAKVKVWATVASMMFLPDHDPPLVQVLGNAAGAWRAEDRFPIAEVLVDVLLTWGNKIASTDMQELIQRRDQETTLKAVTP